jgi:hypothetical protein
MKLILEEISGQGKKRWVFHTGKQEIEILLGLVKNALQYTPRIIGTTQLRHILHNMNRSFGKVINDENEKL